LQREDAAAPDTGPRLAVSGDGVTHMPRSKKRRRWIDFLAYLAIRFVVAFAQMLSIEQSYALARFLGWVIYKVDKRHRQVGIDNLKQAFGDRYTEFIGTFA
jgi:KDO2-lipid IV(A) lauroyltransferase